MTRLPPGSAGIPTLEDLIASNIAVKGGRRVFRGTHVPGECRWEN